MSKALGDSALKALKAWVKAYVGTAVQGGGLSAYPVGAIYMSMNPTSPAEIFGGTWEALDEGRVLIGANTEYPVGATGGEKTHKLTTAEMPSHNHTMVSTGSHIHSGETGLNGNHEHVEGTARIWDAADGYYGVAYPNRTSVAYPLSRWENKSVNNEAKIDCS